MLPRLQCWGSLRLQGSQESSCRCVLAAPFGSGKGREGCDGGCGVGPSHKDLPPFARRRPQALEGGARGHRSQLNTVPSPPAQSKEPGHQHHCHPGLNPGGWGRTRAAVWLSEPPHDLRHVDPTGPEGRDQQVGALGLLSPRPAQHAHLGPEGPLSPRWAPHPVPHPALASPQDPELAQGSPWSQSCGISTHPGRLELCPARQQQQQQQQGQLGRVCFVLSSASLLSPTFIPASLGSLSNEVLAHNIMHQTNFSY